MNAIRIARCLSALPLVSILILSAAPGLFPKSLRAEPTNGFSGELVLLLENAMAEGAHLSVFLSAENGRWLDGFAYANEYNRSVHDVRVTTGVVESTRFTLGLEIAFIFDPTRRGSPWGTAGTGLLEVAFESLPLPANRPDSPMSRFTGTNGVWESRHYHLRTTVGEARLEGVFRGRIKGAEAKGSVAGIRLPLHDSLRDILPVRPEEHPSILFRKSEQEELRSRLSTPAGRVVRELLEARDHEIALGLLYALTGEKVYAEKASKRLASIMEDPDKHTGSGSGYGGGVGLEHQNTQLAGKLGSVAVTYDLCFGTLGPEVSSAIDEWLGTWTEAALLKPGVWANEPQNRPGFHSDAFMIFGSGGLGVLSRWGRRGRMPPEPIQTKGLFGGRFAGSGQPTYEEKHALWRNSVAIWRETGEADLELRDRYVQMLKMCKLCLLQGAIGEGGSLPTMGDYQLPYFDYLIGFHNIFGRALTGRPNEQWLAGRKIVGTVWTSPKPFFEDGLAPNGSAMIRYLALAPREWQPAILGYWCRLLGVKPEAVHTPDGIRSLCKSLVAADVSGLLFVLKHVTPDLKPSGPETVLPLVWESTTKGAYLFRSDWDDPDTVFARLDATPNGSGSGRASGDLFIYGFGRPWIDRTPQTNRHPQTRRDAREATSVVQIAEPRLMTGGENGVRTGSRFDDRRKCSVVTLNLDDCYKDIGWTVETNTEKVVKGHLTTQRSVARWRSFPKHSGIRAVRSFGVDYSGFSGAKALFAVVDRVSGTDDPKEWFLSIPSMANAGAVVTVTNNLFTIRQGEASLHGTVVWPPNPHVEVVNRCAPYMFFRQPRTSTQTYQYSHGDAFTDDSRWPGSCTGSVEIAQLGLVISANGKRDGNFVVLLTLQKGAPPPVTWEGDNGKFAVRVGNRRLAIDGAELSFAE